MQTLVDDQAVTTPAFADINQGMREPFGQAEKRQSGDRSHQKAMDGGMGCQPPLPGEGDITASTLLHGHAIVLQAEIAKKVAHGQQGKQFRSGAKQHP